MGMDADAIEEGRRRWQARYDKARKREADFTTLSGDEVEPVYGPRPGDAYEGFERIGWPGEYPYTRGLHATGYRGRTWTIRQFAGFGNAEQTNERYKMILAAAWRRALRRLRHADPHGARLRRPALARRGGPLRRRHRLRRRHGGPLQGHPARRRHDLDDDLRAGRARLLHVPGRRRAAGRGPRRPQRHAPDGHLQGVHRPEGVALRTRAAPAPHRRPHGVLHEGHPGLQAAVRLRLPHPRGRGHGRAGARVHPRRRLRLRGARSLARDGRRRLRARPVLLLRRAPRLLRGDRQVPRRAPDLGPLDEGGLRGEEREVHVAALPHPDHAASR